MKQYHDYLRHIMTHGVEKEDRTGTGTISVFGHQMRFDLSQGFPLLTTKFTPFRLIAVELLWFLKGNPNIVYLLENNCHIWDEWVKPDGTFGPIYGAQWRSWPDYRAVPEAIVKLESDEKGRYKWIGNDPVNGLDFYHRDIDQLANAITKLKHNPDDRRIIVSAWNVADVESGEMALPPCHAFFQFYSAPMSLHERWGISGLQDDLHAIPVYLAEEVLKLQGVPERKLSCQLYQRSADSFLGVPFNIASYALLTHMVAHLTDHAVGDFIWTGGDCHIYKNHFDQVAELLKREELPLPKLKINREVMDIDDFRLEDFEVVGYQHHPAIKAPVSV